MSTQSPITTEPTACNTNWITKAACKLQAIVEPLCEKRSNFALNLYEQNRIVTEANVIDKWLRIYICASFQLNQTTTTSVLKVVEDWSKETRQSPVWSAEVNSILAPRLTLWNKLGLSAWKAFSVGTTCSCCWGLRFIVVSVVAFSIGFLTRSYL
jgi:hypothetical protein